MRRIFEFLTGLFIVLSATAYLPGHGFDEVQQIVFRIGIVSLWIFSLYLKPIRYVVNIWLNAGLALSFIGTLLLRGQPQYIAIPCLLNVILGIAFFYLIANYVENKVVIMNAVCWVVAINAGIALLQVCHVDPICINEAGTRNTHIVGLNTFRFNLAVYMGLVTPFLLFSRRWFFGVLSLLLTIGSASVSAVAVCGLTSLGVVFYNYRRFFWYAMMGLAVVGIVLYFGLEGHAIPQHPNNLAYKIQSRVDLQVKQFLPVLLKKPTTGYGLGSFKFIGPQLDPTHYGMSTDCWSDFLERGCELGVGIIVIFLCLFWDVVKRFDKTPLFFSLVGIPFAFMFHSVLNSCSIGVICLTLFALWEGQ